MIYIQKKSEPKALKDYRSAQQDKKLELSYNNFSGQYKEETVEHLLYEQNKRCCFCQQLIDKETAVIEHLLPQNYTCNDTSIFKDFDLQYWNMYACCRTKGQCTDSKGNTIIPPLIMSEYCNELFVYNGGRLECTNPSDIQMKYIIDCVLNLNNNVLLGRRSKKRQQISNAINRFNNKNDIFGYIKNYNGPFPGLMFQVCNQKLKLLTK